MTSGFKKRDASCASKAPSVPIFLCCRVCRRRFALVISLTPRFERCASYISISHKNREIRPAKGVRWTHANPSGEEHLAECDRPAARRIRAVERATRSEVPVANGGFPPVLDQSTMATPPVTVKEVVSVRDRARRPEFSEDENGTEIARARLVTDPTRPSRPPNSSRAPASTHNASPSPTSRWRARSSSASARRARRTPSSSLTWRTRRSR